MQNCEETKKDIVTIRTSSSSTSGSNSGSTTCLMTGRVAVGGGGGGGGGGESDRTEKAVAALATIPAPAAAGSAPKFLGVLEVTVALPKAGAFDLNAGLMTGSGAGICPAARLLASSSSACFFARACRSDQVSFLEPPEKPSFEEDC